MLEPYHLSNDVQEALLKNIKRRLTPQAIKMRADVEVTCFSYDGIDAIKEALLSAEALSTAEIPIKIKLVAPPLYVIMTSALSKDEGLALLQKACDTIASLVKSKGGGSEYQNASARCV